MEEGNVLKFVKDATFTNTMLLVLSVGVIFLCMAITGNTFVRSMADLENKVDSLTVVTSQMNYQIDSISHSIAERDETVSDEILALKKKISNNTYLINKLDNDLTNIFD